MDVFLAYRVCFLVLFCYSVLVMELMALLVLGKYSRSGLALGCFFVILLRQGLVV